MIVYSEKIIGFLCIVKKVVKEILTHEASLRVSRDRFYDQTGRFSYPIHIVIYHSKNVLGYFNAPFYEIGINEVLMHAKVNDLKNVIRHEIAHYLTFINHGAETSPHGFAFKECCAMFGWGEEVSKASICLEELSNAPPHEKASIFRRVQKLMALSSSSSQNEAEAAIIKSQTLLLKHNINAVHDEDDTPRIFLKRVLKQKRKSAKMDAIGKILETFFVSIVYHKVKDGIYLEILGDKVNVEIADYVASILETELEILWQNAQKTARLKGSLAKNSFFMGVAKGYHDKIESLKKEFNADTERALIVIEKKLSAAREMAYKRLSSSTSSARHSKEAALLGQKAGKNLTINPGIQSSSQTLLPKHLE